MDRLRSFLRRESTVAFLMYSAVYAALAAFIWWGAWPLDRTVIQPDHGNVFPPDRALRFLRDVLAGAPLVPFDLHWFLGSPYWWAELEYAVPCWLAGLAVRFHLRGRGLGNLPGYGAGLSFALSGYSLTLFSAGHMGWFEFITYGIFAFGLADRAVRKGRWRNWALLGAVLAWGAARQQDLWMLFTALAALYGVRCIVRESLAGRLRLRGGLRDRRCAARIAAGLALCALVAFAVGMPMFADAITHSLEGRKDQIKSVSEATGVDTSDPKAAAEAQWEFATNWSMPPEDILEFVAAGVRGDSSDPRVSPSRPYWGRLGRPVDSKFVPGRVMPNYRQHSLYLGVVTVVLAIFGVVGWIAGLRGPGGEGLKARLRRAVESDVPFWTAAALWCVVLSMGRFTPAYRLVYSLPVMDYLRAPVKFHHLTELCVSVLAGYGVATALGGTGKARAAAAWVCGALAAALMVLGVAFGSDAAAISAGIAKLGIARTQEMCAALAANMSSSVLLAGAVCALSAAALWAAARFVPRRAPAVAAVLLALNAVMLAYSDRRYCAVYSLSFARGRNDAAEAILARGGGKVLELLRGALNESLVANGVCDVTADPQDRTVRFAVLPAGAERDASISGFLRSRRAERVGGYILSASGVRGVQGGQPQLSLYEFAEREKQAEKPRKTSVLSVISVLSTFFMLGWAVKIPAIKALTTWASR